MKERMKSTDMFSSAHERKADTTPLVLPDQTVAKGVALSPYVISLWEDTPKKSLTKEKKNTNIPQEKNHHNTASPIYQESSLQKPNSKPFSVSEIFTPHEVPESEISVPSRETQIEKVKQAMKHFEEVTGKSSQASNHGFFRNLSSLLHS